MHTRESFFKDLEKLIINPQGILLVHSSCKSIDDVDGGPDAVLDKLLQANPELFSDDEPLSEEWRCFFHNEDR